MKSVLFATVLLFASLSMAGLELKVDNTTLNLTDGTLQQSDGTTVTAKAPWMMISFTVTNNTTQNVTLVQFGLNPGVASHATHVDGVPLAPGESFSYSSYADALPGDNINYAVFELDGVMGNDTNPIPLASAAFSVAVPAAAPAAPAAPVTTPTAP